MSTDGHTWTSNDGTHWTDTPSNAVAGYLTYGDGAYVTPGWLALGRSVDGINWDEWTSTGETNSLNAIAYAQIPSE